jgi:hypothetical protein
VPNDRSSLLKMGKRPLPSAPPVVPLEQMEEALLETPGRVAGSDNTPELSERRSDVSQVNAVQPAVQQYSGSFVQPTESHDEEGTLALGQSLAPTARTLGTKLVPKSGRRRVLTVSATFRLPEELHARLKRISQHNQIDMTDITIEALELHLPNFEDPS